jgi:hypothetical protein
MKGNRQSWEETLTLEQTGKGDLRREKYFFSREEKNEKKKKREKKNVVGK